MNIFYQLKKIVTIVSLLVLFAHLCSAQHIIKGTVLNKSVPIQGAIVSILNTNWGAATDSLGRFEIHLDTIGQFILQITYLGFETRQQELILNNNNSIEMELGFITLKDNSSYIKETTIKGKYKQGSEREAIALTRKSNKIETILSQESIQQLPDKNVAEAVQRVAGAKMDRNKGEGSNVSLRGTPGDWTSILLNGDRLPTADEDNPNRTFEFEVFPANLVDNIFITRTVTPDIEADNIGGVINFQTTAPADKRTLNIDFGAGENILANSPLGELKLLLGDISKNKKLTFAISGSYYYRAYATDAMQIAYGTNFNHGINTIQLKDYFGDRTTIGFNGALQYKPIDKITLTAHFMHGRMDDNKYQYLLGYDYTDEGGSGSKIHQQGTHGLLERRLYGGDLTVVYSVTPKFSIDAKVAGYYNSFQYGKFPTSNNDSVNGYVTYDFPSNLLQFNDVIKTHLNGKAININDTDKSVYTSKFIGKDDPYGTGDNYNNIRPKPDTSFTKNPVFYFYKAFSNINRTHENDPIVAQMNFNYKINDKIKLKWGIKGKYKEGSRYITQYTWYQQLADPNIPTDPIPLNHFQLSNAPRSNSFLSELGSAYQNILNPFLSKSQMASFISHLGDTLRNMPMDAMTNPAYYLWAGGKYQYFETTESGYLMADLNLGEKWKLVSGLRVENTLLRETADTVEDTLTSTFVGSNFYLWNRPKPAIINRSYLAILPSLNVEYLINSNSMLRLAVSRTFHRPNFEETKPGAAVINYEALEFTYGNPNLKPTYSINLETSYQYYWGSRGICTIGGYFKNVTDHILTTVTADVDPTSGILIKSYQNAAKAYIIGTEASIDKKLDFLPGFWNGFGVNANITYSYSQMEVPGRPKNQAMNEQTPLLYNIGFYYEKNSIKTRIGLNYTGAYLMALNLAADPGIGILHKDDDFDLFRGETYSLDYQISIKFSKHFTAYGEANNLLDAPYKTYIGKEWRVKRLEYYHQRVEIGLKFEL